MIKGKEEFEMKLKKVLSGLTAFCTALAVMPTELSLSSTAAASVTYTVENVSVNAGETVDLAVTVDALSGDQAEAVSGGQLNFADYITRNKKNHAVYRYYSNSWRCLCQRSRCRRKHQHRRGLFVLYV
jgi:hypothetical protein